jgi:hypothetical protein
MNGPARAEWGSVEATLHAGARIVLRACYGHGSQVLSFTVSHESDDHQTVRGPGDLPRHGVTVEQEIQQLIDCRVHAGKDTSQASRVLTMENPIISLNPADLAASRACHPT